MKYIVAIGASGGEGLKDICVLLQALPAALPVVVLVVLHRPTDRISHLRSILSRTSRLPVVIAREGQELSPGTCYIGEPAAHLTLVSRNFAHLIKDPENLLRNRTIDALFLSVAACAKERVIGVVLSGSLDDGSRGLAAINKAGGVAMVLKSGGEPWHSMAENAQRFDGPLDKIGSPEELASEITRLVEQVEPA